MARRPAAEKARVDALVDAVDRLGAAVSALRFAEPVTHVYNPLDYARELTHAYLRRFGGARGRVLLLGMNPGPWGMAQTGVPFGEIAAVRDWMGLRGNVRRPAREHPKRPVTGLDCERAEVSGARLWGWAAERFGAPEAFFERFFVWNWCPLAFMEAGGRNRTPDKLPAAERAPLEAACDASLREIVALLEPGQLLGVGTFAQKRAEKALGEAAPPLGRVLHPSPASPIANRGWAPQAERQLREFGIPIPGLR